MKNHHVILDLETLGTRPGSVILTIGAVLLSKSGIEDNFYRAIQIESCAAAGLKIDPSTLLWWMDQEKPAIDAAFHDEAAITLDQALQEFAIWIPASFAKVPLWGNGANFDNSLLEAAHLAAQLPVPWKYSQDRCFRTLRALHPEIEAPEWPTDSIKHHALHDAQHEAEHLYQILTTAYAY